MKTRTIAVQALLLSCVVGCRQDEIVAGVTDSSFVSTMTALHRITNDEHRDSAARAVARDSLLQSRDLTPDQLERAGRALGKDPERALALWQRIRKEGGPEAPR
jgi:hypothetical protein